MWSERLPPTAISAGFQDLSAWHGSGVADMQTPAAHVHMTALHHIVGSRVGNEISAAEPNLAKNSINGQPH